MGCWDLGDAVAGHRSLGVGGMGFGRSRSFGCLEVVVRHLNSISHQSFDEVI